MIRSLKIRKGIKRKLHPLHPDPQAASDAVLRALPETVYTPLIQMGAPTPCCFHFICPVIYPDISDYLNPFLP